MRKFVLLTIPLLVVILLATTLLIINFNQPPDWQDELHRYLQYKNTSISGKYMVVSTVKARKPWNFIAEMSLATFGESMYYQTEIHYSKETPDLETDSTLSKEPSKGNLISLPYPPAEVWCVLLERENQIGNDLPAKGSQNIVLVGLHQDLYNTDYIIHEIPKSMQTTTSGEVATTIGCDVP